VAAAQDELRAVSGKELMWEVEKHARDVSVLERENRMNTQVNI
jgi:hypothetical protein